MIRGTYVLMMLLRTKSEMNIGSLGRVSLQSGWYAYAGSAMNGLLQRVNRHFISQKKMHWHVDYLSALCDTQYALLFLEGGPSECEFASMIRSVGGLPAHPRFGSSDCRCSTHLFYIFPEVLEELISWNYEAIMCKDAIITAI